MITTPAPAPSTGRRVKRFLAWTVGGIVGIFTLLVVIGIVVGVDPEPLASVEGADVYGYIHFLETLQADEGGLDGGEGRVDELVEAAQGFNTAVIRDNTFGRLVYSTDTRQSSLCLGAVSLCNPTNAVAVFPG